uniref:Uncharacterized protein n=1 Tax=Arundo donax TaxID=35708 RepID=A0A0A9H0W3_ARUDO
MSSRLKIFISSSSSLSYLFHVWPGPLPLNLISQPPLNGHTSTSDLPLHALRRLQHERAM